MGLGRVHPEDVDIQYDTLGDAGVTLCGELRSDGERIYAIFKAGENLESAGGNFTPVYISAYSTPDISVKCAANTDDAIGVPGFRAASGKYVWVCLRGTPQNVISIFSFGADTNIGDSVGAFFGDTFSGQSTTIKKGIALTAVTDGNTDDTASVHMVR